MTPSRSSRRRQTRLTFNPLPTSSPARSDLPEQLQTRAAAIRYDTVLSPSKRKRVLTDSSGQAKLNFASKDASRKSKRIAGFEALLPTPEPSSQVEARVENDSDSSSSTTTSSSLEDILPVTPIKTFGRGNLRKRAKRIVLPSSSSSSDQIEETNDEPFSQRQHSKTLDQPLNDSPDNRSDVLTRRLREDRRTRQRHARSGGQSRPLPIESSSEEDPDTIPVGSIRRRTRKVQDDARDSHTITRSRSSRRDRPANGNSRSPSTLKSSDSDDSLMDELRKPTASTAQDDEGSTDESEELNVRKGRPSIRRRRLRNDDSPSLMIRKRSPGIESQSDEEILNSARRRSHPKRGTQPTPEKSARQLQLDQLRKRRAGKAVPISLDSSSNSDVNEITDPDEDSGTERVRQAITSNLDEYEEDFLDDDDDTLGVPAGLEDIPLEFTRHANKKPIEHFKDLIEWMVHNKINPAFARNDPVYTLAVQKLDDVAQGFAGSKFISTAWRPEFLAALKRYPDLASTGVPTMLDQKCEACGRSGHPAKHQLIFSGKPYDRTSLEDASSSDEDSDEGAYTQHSTSFSLGRTCNANAEIAHALYHWRYQLNHFVLDLLRAEGHTTPEKIIQREGWSVKKRERYANEVVDGIEADGQMRVLYKEFKENLEAAREVKVSDYLMGLCEGGDGANGRVE
ncbi:MAG: hypothetical protein Q9220_003573 [cf. Caloplaca sp. 1 TL-2023]